MTFYQSFSDVHVDVFCTCCNKHVRLRVHSLRAACSELRRHEWLLVSRRYPLSDDNVHVFSYCPHCRSFYETRGRKRKATDS